MTGVLQSSLEREQEDLLLPFTLTEQPANQQPAHQCSNDAAE